LTIATIILASKAILFEFSTTPTIKPGDVVGDAPKSRRHKRRMARLLVLSIAITPMGSAID
jgi:hypothetical protein